MKNSNKRPGVPITDIEKINFDKELVIKVLSKPENQEKILKTNQEIMKALNGENSSIIFDTANIDNSEKVKRPQVKIDNKFEE